MNYRGLRRRMSHLLLPPILVVHKDYPSHSESGPHRVLPLHLSEAVQQVRCLSYSVHTSFRRWRSRLFDIGGEAAQLQEETGRKP
jgi:hypothetical protein